MKQEPPDWNTIVDRHAERVFRIASRILGSVHDAEDVSQTVFAEAVKLHASGPIQSWTGLFVRLATLRAIDLLRSRRDASPLCDHDSVSGYGPAEEAVGAELAEWLREATSKLPDQQGALLSLAHFEQMDRNEIAAILAIPPEAVSTSLYKARQRLLSQLNVFYGGSNG